MYTTCLAMSIILTDTFLISAFAFLIGYVMAFLTLALLTGEGAPNSKYFVRSMERVIERLIADRASGNAGAALKKSKTYDEVIKKLEDEQGEWYVNHVLEKALKEVLDHNIKYDETVGSGRVRQFQTRRRGDTKHIASVRALEPGAPSDRESTDSRSVDESHADCDLCGDSCDEDCDCECHYESEDDECECICHAVDCTCDETCTDQCQCECHDCDCDCDCNDETEEEPEDDEPTDKDDELADKDDEPANKDDEPANKDDEHADRGDEHADRDDKHADRDDKHTDRDDEHANNDNDEDAKHDESQIVAEANTNENTAATRKDSKGNPKRSRKDS